MCSHRILKTFGSRNNDNAQKSQVNLVHAHVLSLLDVLIAYRMNSSIPCRRSYLLAPIVGVVFNEDTIL